MLRNKELWYREFENLAQSQTARKIQMSNSSPHPSHYKSRASCSNSHGWEYSLCNKQAGLMENMACLGGGSAGFESSCKISVWVPSTFPLQSALSLRVSHSECLNLKSQFSNSPNSQGGWQDDRCIWNGKASIPRSSPWLQTCSQEWWVSPRLWVATLSAGEGLSFLPAGSTLLHLSSKPLVWRQNMWLVRQVARKNTRAHCRVHSHSNYHAHDIRGMWLEVSRGCII